MESEAVSLKTGETKKFRCLGDCQAEFALTLEPGRPSNFGDSKEVVACPFCGEEFYEEA